MRCVSSKKAREVLPYDIIFYADHKERLILQVEEAKDVMILTAEGCKPWKVRKNQPIPFFTAGNGAIFAEQVRRGDWLIVADGFGYATVQKVTGVDRMAQSVSVVFEERPFAKPTEFQRRDEVRKYEGKFINGKPMRGWQKYYGGK